MPFGLAIKSLNRLKVGWVKAHVIEGQLKVFRIEDPQHDGFTKNRRQGTETKVEDFFAEFDFNAAVLRFALFLRLAHQP